MSAHPQLLLSSLLLLLPSLTEVAELRSGGAAASSWADELLVVVTEGDSEEVIPTIDRPQLTQACTALGGTPTTMALMCAARDAYEE